MKNEKKQMVIYTAIFGKKDHLRQPMVDLPNCDLICFTDQNFHSRTWRIINVPPPLPGDFTRSARKYKILAHEFLPEYDISIWVDGNILIKQDLTELVTRYLADTNLAVCDHAYWKAVPVHSLREELDLLLKMEREGKHQDDPRLMEHQATQYFHEGYPDTNGLAWTLLLLRRHHEPDVRAAMNMWWEELTRWSKRDQLSFNYVAWKTGLRFTYIPLDGSDNQYLRRLNHYMPWYQVVNSYRIGMLKRLRKICSIVS